MSKSPSQEYDRQRHLRKKAWVNAQKPPTCAMCGREFPPEKLVWHHRDPTTKRFNVGISYHSRALLEVEITLCDAVCRGCHARFHGQVKTHCKHGHEYTASNTGRHKNGRRYCRECARQRGREAYARGYRAPSRRGD